MKTNRLQTTAIFLIVLSLTIFGCSLTGPAPASPSSPDAAPANPNLPPAPQATESPSATPVPAPTATLILPLAMGASLPKLGSIISSDNVKEIVEIARWGSKDDPLWSVAFAPDGRILAAAGSENIVKLWDLSSAGEPRTFSGHTGKVTSVAFSADGKTLAAGSEDKSIKLWDVASGQELRTFSTRKDDKNFLGMFRIVFSADGRMLVSMSETMRNYDFFYYADLWDVASGKLVHTWGKNFIGDVAFSPDGKMLAFGNGGPLSYKDNVVLVADVASGRDVHTFRGYERRVNTVAFSPDGKTLASGSDDATIKLWDVASGKELNTLNNNFDLGGGQDPLTLSVTSVAFSPDGKTLVSGSEQINIGVAYNTLTLWDVAGGQSLGYLAGYTGPAYNLAFSLDGRFITSDSGDGTTHVWGVYP